MSFLVTALKWRPQKFEEVVGQQHITQTLKNAVKANRIAHAYIFAGPRGVGKTTTARIFTRSINCLTPVDGEPCNECAVCNSFMDGKSLDIIEIDGASNRRIEEVRNLLESVKYAPTRANHKVYIIDEVHMLTTESFNALLKTLEEPPEHTKFIFATTDIHKVPATITSRCQRFDFRRIEVNEIKSLLHKIAEAEKIEIDDRSLTFIAKKADGALRDAESLFDQVVSFCGTKVEVDVLSQMLNLIDEDIYFEVTDSIIDKKFAGAFEITQKIYDNGWNFIDFSNGLTEHLRNILTVVIRNDIKLIETSEEDKERYLNYKDKFSEADLVKLLAYLNTYQYELKSTSNQKLKTEIALTNIIALEKSSTISELIEFFQKGIPTIIEPVQKKKIVDESGTLQKNNDIKPEPQVVNDASLSYGNTQVDLTSSPNKSGNDLETKLKNVIAAISEERSLFGPVFEHVQLISSNDNHLVIVAKNSDDIDILEKESKYIQKKIVESFGKNTTFEFQLGDVSSPKVTSDSTSETSENPDNELINSIIDELGGKEIIR